MANSGIQAISKITVRDCGANAASVLAMEGADARAPLIRVWGYARGFKEVKSQNRLTGETTSHKAIQGDFRAVNFNTGERFSSGLLYLPSGIHELILSPLEKAKSDNEDAELQFGFDIYGRKSSSPAGYGYVAVILGQDPTVVDAMGELEQKLSQVAGAPALPAPPPKADQLKIEKK
jgi:hypothetical protein